MKISDIEAEVRQFEKDAQDGGFGMGRDMEIRSELLRKIRGLVAALEWTVPLAERALDEHRLQRILAGHKDITATAASGLPVVGLWQTEVDAMDRARAILKEAKE